MADGPHVIIALADGTTVPGLWLRARNEAACLVLAHGAGGGMASPSMNSLAEGLAARRITTLRYQFPFMARGSKRPDRPEIAHRAVRAAVAEAHRSSGALPLVAGGRSFGGRMTSQAQAVAAIEGVRALVFFAFPLHPAGKPSVARADHLGAVDVPMLFVQGTRDPLARLDLLEPKIASLGVRATLQLSQHADHGFHVPARTGRDDAGVLDTLLDATAAWIIARTHRGDPAGVRHLEGSAEGPEG